MNNNIDYMVISTTKTNTCRLRCPLENSFKEVFISLSDYRNRLFISNDLNKIIEFYGGFENRDQLIQWMKERPKGASYIHEVEGDRDIIVVIPTADFNGKYARTCREEIFTGLHMIFVESGENPDPYFNYAHNCNVGIKKAMDYNPKWIVLSNDDMYKIDEVSILIDELHKIDPRTINTVYTKTSFYHSIPEAASVPRKSTFFIYKFIRFVYHAIFGWDEYELVKERIKSKYKIKVKSTNTSKFMDNLFYTPMHKYILTAAFGIFSPYFIKNNNNILFDETFINGGEDNELSIRLSKNMEQIKTINYIIGDYVGSSLGKKNKSRWYRDVLNQVYLNFLYSHELNIFDFKESNKKV